MTLALVLVDGLLDEEEECEGGEEGGQFGAEDEAGGGEERQALLRLVAQPEAVDNVDCDI